MPFVLFIFLTLFPHVGFCEPSRGTLELQMNPPGNSVLSPIPIQALNLWVNSLSQSSNLKTWDEKILKEAKSGILTIDVSSHLKNSQLDFLRSHNPYACPNESKSPIRMDWLISFSFGPNYYEALGLDMSENGQRAVSSLENLLGLKFDFKHPSWSKALYGKGESRITRYRRTVMKAFSPKMNSDTWVTLDQDLEDLGESANPFEIQPQKGEKTLAAGELIGSLPNGMPLYALITKSPEGNLILANAAPGNLVTNNFPTKDFWKSSHFLSGKGDNPAAISNAYQCITCHRDGLVGPHRGLSLKESDIKEFLKKHGHTQELQHFKSLSEEDYEQGVQANKDKLLKTLKSANAFLSDPKNKNLNSPFIADITTDYTSSLTLDRIANELGTNAAVAKQALEVVDRNNSAVPVSLQGDPPSLSRGVFESFYCKIKAAVAELHQNSAPTQSMPSAPSRKTH